MESLFSGLIVGSKRMIGIIIRPYATYRDISQISFFSELIGIGALCGIYVACASIVKATTFRPYFLTRQFVLLCSTLGIGYILMSCGLYIFGKLAGGTGSYKTVAIGWGYTLIPTILWFLMTGLLFVLLPPPRTTQPQGILFSIVYLVLSSTLLWWKVTLAYLTLRFGHRLTLSKIFVIACCMIPVVLGFGLISYSRSITAIPLL